MKLHDRYPVSLLSTCTTVFSIPVGRSGGQWSSDKVMYHEGRVSLCPWSISVESYYLSMQWRCL